MHPGRLARRDYAYQRNGTANAFCGVERRAGVPFTKATPTRSSPEFAGFIRGNTVRSLTEPATEQSLLRGVAHGIADFAATQMREPIDSAALTARQVLEDVQAGLHEAIAGDTILKNYSVETRKRSPPSSSCSWMTRSPTR